MSSTPQDDVQRPFRRYLSKTPEISAFFWIVKVLASAAGAPVADLLSDTVHLGIGITTMLVTTAVTVAVLIQLSVARYVLGLFWLVVVLISVLGSLITDNLTGILDVPLGAAVIAEAALLTGIFAAWFATEKTLSIHTIDTGRREAFYWLAVLLTFALGTATERLAAPALGTGRTALACAVVLLAVGIGGRLARVTALIMFWVAYVVTQPLGVAAAGLLSEPRNTGGLGVGDAGTSVAVLGAIVVVVRYVSVTHRDDPSLERATRHLRSWPGP
jgi:uncharacterized membrane-anchored protein